MNVSETFLRLLKVASAILSKNILKMESSGSSTCLALLLPSDWLDPFVVVKRIMDSRGRHRAAFFHHLMRQATHGVQERCAGRGQLCFWHH